MKIIFSSIGAPFFAEYLAKITGHEFVNWKNLLSPKYYGSHLFLVGLYYPTNKIYYKLKQFKSMIILFAGSDILKLNKMELKDRSRLFEHLKNNRCVFATESKEIYDRILLDYSLETEIIYLPSKDQFNEDPFPMPEKFSIGCYMPCNISKGNSKRFFYGFSTIIDVVKMIPDVDFYFYCRGGYVDISGETKMKNFIGCEKEVTDMKEFLKKISCGLRFVKHDTYSMSAIEYNMAGRWFINNYPMPFCDKISHDASADEIKDKILEVSLRKGINIDGMLFYRKNHDKNVFLRKVKSIFDLGK